MSSHDPDKREGTAVSFPVSGGDGHRKLDKADDTYHHVNHSGARLLNKFGVLKGYPPHKGEEREKWDSFWDRIEAAKKQEEGSGGVFLELVREEIESMNKCRAEFEAICDVTEEDLKAYGHRSVDQCGEGAERSDERSTDQASDDRGTTEGSAG